MTVSLSPRFNFSVVAVSIQNNAHTPTSTPNQCAPVTFSQTGTYPQAVTVHMSTTTTGAIIFYTRDGTTPTHNGSTATGTTATYSSSSPPKVLANTEADFLALAYKAGMTDSVVTEYDVDNENNNDAIIGGPKTGRIGAPLVQQQTMVTTTIYSVWDGDWAVLEEYDNTGARVQGYVEGYHGLVKTLADNIYYYQDELGSTSHIADIHGALLEYYKYDLYGKPTYFNSTSQQLTTSTYGVKDLFTGQRWIVEIGLYDDRNRFMSPDLGRFLQPDPIGFKGDASNLYRYCGNDWANRSDPMGTQDVDILRKQQASLGHSDTTVDGWGKITVWLGGIPQAIARAIQAFNNEPWQNGASAGGSTKVKWTESGGNSTDENSQDHYTDAKLQVSGEKAAGLTTKPELTTRANDDGSVTANMKWNWSVRREAAAQDPNVAAVEHQHTDAFREWMKDMQSPSSQGSQWFGTHHYNTPQRAAEAVGEFYAPRLDNEFKTQRLTLDCRGCAHELYARRFNLTD